MRRKNESKQRKTHGLAERKLERTMRLSDAFLEPQEEPACEVKVKFENIGAAELKAQADPRCRLG